MKTNQMVQLREEDFFGKYNIDKDEFDKLDITWDLLMEIFEDYLTFSKTLIPTANTIADILREHPDVHTVKSRIKDPEHLIEKIVRKLIEKSSDSSYKITIDSYKKLITDLIGIRVLHLYKDQAFSIDSFIQKTWPLEETATIYYRKGVNVTLNNNGDEKNYEPKEHPAGYRSWHYLIRTNLTKVEHIAEVQVRTIFEEGWSEIDHQLRYPYDLDNALIKDQLLVLNRVAGSADEMANAIRETKIGLSKLVNQNEEYKRKIEELSQKLEKALDDKTLNKELAKDLQKKIDDLKPAISWASHPLVGMDSSNYVTSIGNKLSRNINTTDDYFHPRKTSITRKDK